MARGLAQTFLVRIPMSYFMSISRMHPSRRLVWRHRQRPCLELFCAVFILWYSGERKKYESDKFLNKVDQTIEKYGREELFAGNT